MNLKPEEFRQSTGTCVYELHPITHDIAYDCSARRCKHCVGSDVIGVTRLLIKLFKLDTDMPSE